MRTKSKTQKITFNEYKKVISASRRIDMVACFPDETAAILHQKCPPDKVHSLVIWTKNPHNLLYHPGLNKQILQYDQLFIHYTITGMGSTALEPRVPVMEESLRMLSDVIKLAGSPKRIRIRFDPIVHLVTPEGTGYTNFPVFKIMAPQIGASGIRDVSISWMTVYKKVRLRLARAGYRINELSPEQWRSEVDTLMAVAAQNKLNIHACSVPGLPISRCIDGALLSELHPKAEPCSEKRAKGQRKLCGCTESWDIGWYYKCPHGCRYCYANPAD